MEEGSCCGVGGGCCSRGRTRQSGGSGVDMRNSWGKVISG